jgi:putative transposase
MSKHVYKRHNKNLLLYHIVCPAKYRRKVFAEEVEQGLKQICLEIEKRYEIGYMEIGADEDHVHFLIQSVPAYTPGSVVQTTKSITAKEIFKRYPEVKKMLWGGKFWTSGYYINTVGQYGNEKIIANYVKNQGKHYKQIHRRQPTLFDGME